MMGRVAEGERKGGGAGEAKKGGRDVGGMRYGEVEVATWR